MAKMEPMDIDSINCEFDNKENSLQHSNLLSHLPSTEKGYEELDVSELNMKLRYSNTPVTSPMSKSFTSNSLDNRTFECEGYNNNSVDIENCSLTRSLNSTITKNDPIKVLKSLPLQVLSNETSNDNRNGSVLETLDATHKAQDCNVTITYNEDKFIDDSLSLPSTSSSCAQTPEATTPTKETLKHDGSSPIIRGLKSVLNMFRSSQSPIPPAESDNIEKVSTAQIKQLLNEASKSQQVTASTPISNKHKEACGSLRSSPLKESIVFNDDLERELQWKDETTILFKEEKIPIHKLLLPESISTLSKPSDSVSCTSKLEKEKNNITIEHMDISNVDSFVDMGCTKSLPVTNNTDFNEQNFINESDSEFVDCETSINIENNVNKISGNCKDNLQESQTIIVSPSNDLMFESEKELDLKNNCEHIAHTLLIKESNFTERHTNIVPDLDVNPSNTQIMSSSMNEIDNGNFNNSTIHNIIVTESNLVNHNLTSIVGNEDVLINDDPKVDTVNHIELPYDVPLPDEDEIENKINIEENINQTVSLEQGLRGTVVKNHILRTNYSPCNDNKNEEKATDCAHASDILLQTINDNVSRDLKFYEEIFDKLSDQNKSSNETLESLNTEGIERQDDINLQANNIDAIDSITPKIPEIYLQTSGRIKESDILKQNDNNETDFMPIVTEYDLEKQNCDKSMWEELPIETEIADTDTLAANRRSPSSDKNCTELNEKVDGSNQAVRKLTVMCSKETSNDFESEVGLNANVGVTAESNFENVDLATLSAEVYTSVNPENIKTDTSSTIDLKEITEEQISKVCRTEEPQNIIQNEEADCTSVELKKPCNNAIVVNPMDVEMLEICDVHKACSLNDRKLIMDINDIVILEENTSKKLQESTNTVNHIEYNDISMQEVYTNINMSVSHDEAIEHKSLPEDTHVNDSKANIISTKDDSDKQCEILQNIPSYETCENESSEHEEKFNNSNGFKEQSLISDVSAVSKVNCNVNIGNNKDTSENQIYEKKHDISESMNIHLDILKTGVNIDFDKINTENNSFSVAKEVVKQNNENTCLNKVSHRSKSLVTDLAENPTENHSQKIYDIVSDIADNLGKSGGEADCVRSEDNLQLSPPLSPKISSKGSYNFNFDEIEDPFATKTKIRLSTSPEGPRRLSKKNVNGTKCTNIINDFQKRKSLPHEKHPSQDNNKINCTFNDAVSYEKVNNKQEGAIKGEPFTLENKFVYNNRDNLTVLENVSTNSLSEESVELSEPSKEIITEVNIPRQDILTDHKNTIKIESNLSEQKLDSGNNYESKNVFNIPEMSSEMGINSFVTKSRVCRTPSPELKVSSTFNNTKHFEYGEASQVSNTKHLNSCTTKIVSKSLIASKVDHDSSTTSSSSKVTEEATVREVNTEDEDTVEGPFFEADDISGDEKLSNPIEDNDDMMNFKDMQVQGADANVDNGEIFIDAEAFEFLLNQNKSNVVADSGKESLFLKFDPLFAKRMSSDGVLAALNKVHKRQSTPKRVSKAPTVNITYSDKNPPEPLNLNVTTDANNTLENNFEDPNATVSKPMMVVNPAINSIISPRSRSIVTPPRANRRSLTFTSPAMAVIDRLLSLSGNSSTLNPETPTPQARREQNQTDLALTQLRELLAEKEIHVHNLRLESKELKDRLSTLESQVKSLESESENRLKKVNELNERLLEKTNINKSMAAVVEEYERTIASLIAETEQDKKRHADERMRLINERDEQTAHLASMEISFNDLHSKYEKSKQVILSCKANEDAYRRSVKEFEESLLKMQNNYELLKQHATSKLNHANQELEKLNRSHEAEVLKLNAMIKRKDLHITSLEESLAQKTKANEELTAICDELINKVG